MSYGTPTTRRVYIAGPMSGYPEDNFPAFDRARDAWRAQGWDVVSPADLSRAWYIQHPDYRDGVATGSPPDYRAFLPQDIQAIATCDAMAFLPGWERSRGAQFERHFARLIGLDEYDAETMALLQAPDEPNPLERANALVFGDRGAAYSHPLVDYTATAKLASGLLGPEGRDALKRDLDAEDLLLVMLAVKLSRLSRNADHYDSQVDIAGYLLCYWRARRARQGLEAALEGG